MLGGEVLGSATASNSLCLCCICFCLAFVAVLWCADIIHSSLILYFTQTHYLSSLSLFIHFECLARRASRKGKINKNTGPRTPGQALAAQRVKEIWRAETGGTRNEPAPHHDGDDGLQRG
ncbi:hypothetical protein LZ30DRAFT_131793 [Colletotrichum cereale]|nr:hypothetical protein LZ30DRAFT_131793 [Colletotrichum cereale]